MELTRGPRKLATIDYKAKRPEQGLDINGLQLTMAVVIPTALPYTDALFSKNHDDYYNCSFIDTVLDICSAHRPPREHAPKIPNENVHFDFKDEQSQYTVLVCSVTFAELQKDSNSILLPSHVSVTIDQAQCVEEFQFLEKEKEKVKSKRQRNKLSAKEFMRADHDISKFGNVSARIEPLLELQDRLIRQLQKTQNRFLNLSNDNWTKDHYEAGNTIFSEMFNCAAGTYFEKLGFPLIERVYNVGGGYEFGVTKIQKPALRNSSLFGHDITLSAEEQENALSGNHRINRLFKWTKPGEMDAACNLQFINEARLGAHRITSARVKRAVDILNNTKQPALH